MQIDLQYRPTYSMALVQLQVGESIVAEGGAMVSSSPNVSIETNLNRGRSGGLLGMLGKTMLGGETFFVNTFTARGEAAEVGLAPALVGDIERYDLAFGRSLVIQQGGFLAAAPTVAIDTKFAGLRGLFSGEGLFWLRATGMGPILFNAFGALRAIDVTEPIFIDTGHVVAFEDTLSFEIRRVGNWFSTFFSGEGLVCEFRGTGRLWIQTRNPSEFGQFVGPLLPPRQQ
jgi:uncharacterized protein (TIGR00266 family)